MPSLGGIGFPSAEYTRGRAMREWEGHKDWKQKRRERCAGGVASLERTSCRIFELPIHTIVSFESFGAEGG